MVSSLCQKETNLPGGSNSGPPGWRLSALAHSPTNLLLSDPTASKTICACPSACPSGLVDNCTAQLGTSGNSFTNLYDQYRPILLASVQMSIKTFLLNPYFYHWPVRAIIYVQFHNVCYSV